MSNIHQLHLPHPERPAQLRRWFVEQSERASVAAVTVAVTAAGTVTTKGCAIEPEHAVAMLGELRALMVRLEGFVVESTPELLPGASMEQDLPANVVPLRKGTFTHDHR